MTTITIKGNSFRNFKQSIAGKNIQKHTCDMLGAMRTNVESLIKLHEAGPVAGYPDPNGLKLKGLRDDNEIVIQEQIRRLRLNQRFVIEMPKF